MNDFEAIDYREVDGVAWVTLDRPEVHNAFDETMQAELQGIWDALRARDDIRCVVLTAAGDKAFCTGIDREDVPEGTEWSFDRHTWDDPGERIGPKSRGLFTPVIAAVNGMACGGAFYLLGEVEFIIAADHATFFDPHLTYGMPAVYEPTLMIPRMPFGEIARLTLLGSHERMSARRAHEIGLVSEVVPAGELHDAAGWAATAIASQPARPVRATVEAMWRARQVSTRLALEAAPALLHLGIAAEAFAEGHETFRRERIRPRTR